MRRPWATLPVLVALALAPTAFAQYGGARPDAKVDANGNIFTGGLGFDPDDVSVSVEDVVRWTNRDVLVPHTATERHGLWRLTGDYGETPFNPSGFGPGEYRERAFDGGTFHYLCEVHPEDMKGVVRVADRVQAVGGGGDPRLTVVWGAARLPKGQVFDVQRRFQDGWRTVRRATSKLRGTFDGAHGVFRSRVRIAKEPGSASGWSPPAG